jgi:uncharacterized protein YqiB (DUF1249 family)
MGLYERNFAKLMALIPELEDAAVTTTFEAENAKLCLSILEQSAYTTTISMRQYLGIGGHARDPRMKLRIYHDAQLVEVIGYQNHHRFKPLYLYPNSKMLQPNEKYRVNQFLGDWLDFFIARGYTFTMECLYSGP